MFPLLSSSHVVCTSVYFTNLKLSDTFPQSYLCESELQGNSPQKNAAPVSRGKSPIKSRQADAESDLLEETSKALPQDASDASQN